MSTLSFYFSVSGVQKTHQFSMRQNVKKEINHVLYQGLVDTEDVPCAYVGSQEITPKANIDIIGKEDEVEENSVRVFSGEVKWQGSLITVASSNFLLTDVFGDYKSEESVPFYWKHVLPSGNVSADSIRIVDSDLIEVQEGSYIAIQHNTYDETSGLPIDGSYSSAAVYSNYVNSYNEETGEVNLYFVMYESDGTSHYSLLNQESVFKEATFDDVWSLTGGLKPWEKVYKISPGVDDFIITVPNTTTDYALKLNREGRIFIKDFLDVSDEEPWFPRISNGSFNKLVTSFYNALESNIYRYSVPEFSSQTFNPVSPYKSIVGERALRIRGDVYKVGSTPIKVDSSFYILDVVIKNKHDEVLYALTTDTSKAGSYYYYAGERVFREIELNNAWVTWETDGIISWDQQSGFVHLKDNYPDNYVCEVSYYFEEKYLQYSSLNVNPVFDETYNGQSYALYVVPTGGSNNNVSQSSSVHYVKINASGRIIATSQNGDSGNYDLENVIETDGENIHYSAYAEGYANAVYLTGSSTIAISAEASLGSFPENGVLVIGNNDVTDSTIQIIGYSSTVVSSDIVFNLNSNLTADVSLGTLIRLFSFEDLLTTSLNINNNSPTNNMQWFVIAEISVSADYRPSELSIIDVRERGGVIKEEFYDSAKEIDPRSIWLRPNSITSKGQPIPGETCAVIKLPYTLLTDYGGTFTKDQVEDIVSKHMAVGAMPVVIYHGAIPEITSATATTDSITLCWESEGSDYSYYVHQSSLEDGPWTKINSTAAMEDQVYGNCYTVTGLVSNTVYYFSVTSIDANGIEGPRSIAWGVKTKAN